jgi:DNA-binding NarL/FixJ family response regulator
MQERSTKRKQTMATTQGKRELFEASEYIKKMDLMIAKLRTKKPGELAGKVGKNEILNMRREALQQLIKDGYTVNQIAEAMKDDVFSILPKSITEIVGNKTKKPRVEKRSGEAIKAPSTEPKVLKERDNKKQVGDAGSISVTEDSKDL